MTESRANDVVASSGEGYLVGSLRLLVFLGVVLLLPTFGGELGFSLLALDVLEGRLAILLELIEGDMAVGDGDVEGLLGRKGRAALGDLGSGGHPLQPGELQPVEDRLFHLGEQLNQRDPVAEVLVLLGVGPLISLCSRVPVAELDKMLAGESMGDRILRVDGLELKVPAVDKNRSDLRAELFEPRDFQAEVVEGWGLPFLAVKHDLVPEHAAEPWLHPRDHHGGSEDGAAHGQLLSRMALVPHSLRELRGNVHKLVHGAPAEVGEVAPCAKGVLEVTDYLVSGRAWHLNWLTPGVRDVHGRGHGKWTPDFQVLPQRLDCIGLVPISQVNAEFTVAALDESVVSFDGLLAWSRGTGLDRELDELIIIGEVMDWGFWRIQLRTWPSLPAG